METRIALFQKKEIRKTLHAGEWWFVLLDVVAALSDSANPAGYLKDMRRRDPSLATAGADWEELAAKKKFTPAQLTATNKIRGPLNVPRERFQFDTASRYSPAQTA